MLRIGADEFLEIPEIRPFARDVPVAAGADLHADPQQRVECGAVVPPSVEAEHELLQIDFEVLRPQAVIDAHRPPLHEQEDPADMGQDMGRLAVDFLQFRALTVDKIWSLERLGENFSSGLTPCPDLDHMASAQCALNSSSGQAGKWRGYTG